MFLTRLILHLRRKRNLVSHCILHQLENSAKEQVPSSNNVRIFNFNLYDGVKLKIIFIARGRGRGFRGQRGQRFRGGGPGRRFNRGGFKNTYY